MADQKYGSLGLTQLYEQRNRRREELLGLLFEWYYLQNIVLPRLVFTYDSYFGDFEFEVQKRSRLAMELDRRIELLSIKLRNGEKLTEKTIQFVNTIVDREFERARNSYYQNGSNGFNGGYDTGYYSDHASSGGYDTGYSSHGNNGNNGFGTPENHIGSGWNTRMDCEPTIVGEINVKYEPTIVGEMPQLYRQIVKKLHPDVVGETDLFNKYWYNIQDAYKTRNLRRLRLFHLALCSDDCRVFPNQRYEEISLLGEIREMDACISKERTLIEELKQEEPFIFASNLLDQVWIMRRKRRLRDKIFQIDRRIIHQKRMLRTLISTKSTPHRFETARLFEQG